MKRFLLVAMAIMLIAGAAHAQTNTVTVVDVDFEDTTVFPLDSTNDTGLRNWTVPGLYSTTYFNGWNAAASEVNWAKIVAGTMMVGGGAQSLETHRGGANPLVENRQLIAYHGPTIGVAAPWGTDARGIAIGTCEFDLRVPDYGVGDEATLSQTMVTLTYGWVNTRVVPITWSADTNPNFTQFGLTLDKVAAGPGVTLLARYLDNVQGTSDFGPAITLNETDTYHVTFAWDKTPVTGSGSVTVTNVTTSTVVMNITATDIMLGDNFTAGRSARPNRVMSFNVAPRAGDPNTTLVDNVVLTDLDAYTHYTLGVTTTGNGDTNLGSGPYSSAATYDLVATPVPGNIFLNWSGDTADITDVNDKVTDITLSAGRDIVANFLTSSATFDYDVTIVGAGYVSYRDGNNDAISPVDIPINTVVTMTAVPLPGNCVRGWSGDIGELPGLNDWRSGTVTFNADSDLNLTVTFVPAAAPVEGLANGRLTYDVTHQTMAINNWYCRAVLNSSPWTEFDGNQDRGGLSWAHFGTWNTANRLRTWDQGGAAATPTNAINLGSGNNPATAGATERWVVEWDINSDTDQTFTIVSLTRDPLGAATLLVATPLVFTVGNADPLRELTPQPGVTAIRGIGWTTAGGLTSWALDNVKIEDLSSGSPVTVIDEDFQGATVPALPSPWITIPSGEIATGAVTVDTAGAIDIFVDDNDVAGTIFTGIGSLGATLPGALPVVSFTATPAIGSPPLAVGFNSSVTSYPPASAVEWDFDYNGVTFNVDSTTVNPSHTYYWEQNFVVALRVTNSVGSTMYTSNVNTSGMTLVPVGGMVGIGAAILLGAFAARRIRRK